MTRLLDALDRFDSLHPGSGSARAREEDPWEVGAERSASPLNDRVSSPARGRPRQAAESLKPPRRRVQSAPTHLDLTDDSDTDSGVAASRQTSIDLEPGLPEGAVNKVGSASGRVRNHTPPELSENRSTVRPSATRQEPSPKVDPRLPPAQDDALRLGLQIRAALDKAQTNSLMVCGVEPGQTVRRLTRELALAFVQLRETPVLIVDLEPDEAAEARYEFYPLPETDSATWITPGPMGRPSAAVLCPPKQRQTRRGGFVTSAQFTRNFDNWRAQAALVICCGRSVPDSIATLTAGMCCGATLLVVPGSGSTNESVVVARDLCTRAGMTLLGCAIDHTPSDLPSAD
ncbi:MAG: hypothetical protein EHM89_03610 [Acidobacteria bacterium]|nr:MAG: hypothetical protein EHM89_03610 [Acidobacteriota bacterium]